MKKAVIICLSQGRYSIKGFEKHGHLFNAAAVKCLNTQFVSLPSALLTLCCTCCLTRLLVSHVRLGCANCVFTRYTHTLVHIPFIHIHHMLDLKCDVPIRYKFCLVRVWFPPSSLQPHTTFSIENERGIRFVFISPATVLVIRHQAFWCGKGWCLNAVYSVSYSAPKTRSRGFMTSPTF